MLIRHNQSVDRGYYARLHLLLRGPAHDGRPQIAARCNRQPRPPTPGDAARHALPLSDEDKANQLSDQVGKLMVKCVNLLTAQDPLSLDYCKQQRDLADQYPPQ